MNNCKILLIDTPADIHLISESRANISMPVDIQFVTSIQEAISSIDLDYPDLIMIGSSLIIRGGFDVLSRLGDIPIVILCESYGFSRFMTDQSCNVCFITRPFDLEGIPDMIDIAIEFMASCRSGTTKMQYIATILS